MKLKSYTEEHLAERRSLIIIRLIVAVSLIASVTVGSIFCFKFISSRNSISISNLYKKWYAYDYTSVYDVSGKILLKRPLNNSAHTLRGYSSFYLAVAQTDTTKAQTYLDEAIDNLRIALQTAKSSMKPQLYYMLGKAYFYKDTISSYYYYADLAVKYLEKSKKEGYVANDIPEYLGLSYAALGMTMDSISSFTEALLVRESDSLLLSIAEQYYKAGQSSAAEQYLFRITSSSQDEELIIKSRLLLGQIYTDEKKYDLAEKEFSTILEKDSNCADAYYGLGVIYEKRGNLIKARAEWRNTLRIQVNHPGALQKITDYKQ